MSILAALAKAYDRLPDKPPYGYSRIEEGYCVVLRADGVPAHPPVLRTGLLVPTFLNQRTSGIAPNFLWDKTAYSLGVSSDSKRAELEHEAFVRSHHERLQDTEDEGLLALLRFLQRWCPDNFAQLGWPNEVIDANIVFALKSEYRLRYIHDRELAKSAWDQLLRSEAATLGRCLVTAEIARIARSHPPIKLRRRDAQSSGNFIVSYNEDAFASYGHDQGDNAPVSEEAAFKYTTVLNTFLASKTNHLRIGDASTVFWVDTSDARIADIVESIFRCIVDEQAESDKVKAILSRVREGLIWSAAPEGLAPDLHPGVRFHVLGLAPNAARISVRFWFDDTFGVLAKNYALYLSDMNFEPWPERRGAVGLRRLVLRTAPARRYQNKPIEFDSGRISPQLSGELFRAIVSAGRFPAGLLSLLLLRIRTDGILDSVRIALIKAIVVRTMRLENRLPRDANNKAQEDYLVRSDPNDPNPARRLGRLFAIVERAQLAALGDEINTTVKDKYLGTAAATPSRIMSKLVLNAEQHHIKRLRNGHSDAKWISDSAHARRVGASLQRDIGALFASFNDTFPSQHSSEEQAFFLVGYYQERFGPKGGGVADDPPDDIDITETNEETPE